MSKKHHILVVEDESELAKSTLVFLSENGYTAMHAADLKSALGQPTKSKKADPEGKVTDIVRSGKVDTQQSSPTRAQTITPKQNILCRVTRHSAMFTMNM